MQAIKGRSTGPKMSGNHSDADETFDALVDALKTMGLDALDPADVAQEFRLPPHQAGSILERGNFRSNAEHPTIRSSSLHQMVCPAVRNPVCLRCWTR